MDYSVCNEWPGIVKASCKRTNRQELLKQVETSVGKGLWHREMCPNVSAIAMSEIVPWRAGARPPHQSAASASCAAARDDATISSFIVARVAPTNSLRAARASSVSKSTSVRITHGAD